MIQKYFSAIKISNNERREIYLKVILIRRYWQSSVLDWVCVLSTHHIYEFTVDYSDKYHKKFELNKNIWFNFSKSIFIMKVFLKTLPICLSK